MYLDNVPVSVNTVNIEPSANVLMSYLLPMLERLTQSHIVMAGADLAHCSMVLMSMPSFCHLTYLKT
jgi:hypothetical protein